MILWCDGSHDPAENMRRDLALLTALEDGRRAEPVLRLFRFAPHGITLGAAQDPARVLDLEACRRDGVPWARRPTGGRAIFHAEEWTYSFASLARDPEWGGNLGEAYAKVARGIIASLLRLGVPVEGAPAGEPGERARGGASNAACFATTVGHEVVLGGRKLVGSAQRRLSRAYLQQGSVLLGDGHLRLADYVARSADPRGRLRDDLARRTAHAGRFIGEAPLERWAQAWGAVLPSPPRRVSEAEGLSLFDLGAACGHIPPRDGS